LIKRLSLKIISKDFDKSSVNSETNCKNSNDKIETISNGKKSYTSKSNSKKKISFSIDQTKLPLKSKIIIFKKNHKSKVDTQENQLHLHTESSVNKEPFKLDKKDVLLTETNDRSSTMTTFSYKKLNSLNNKNFSLKTNYISKCDIKSSAPTKRTESLKQDIKSPSIKFNANSNIRVTPQKDTSFKNYLNLVNFLIKFRMFIQ
jgi:hypothetical protein